MSAIDDTLLLVAVVLAIKRTVPLRKKVVNYTRIVCQNVGDVLLNTFVIRHPKILRILRDIEI